MIEATAVGCVVITDLPIDESYPAIDANLVRVPTGTSLAELTETVRCTTADYDEDRQRRLAAKAIRNYDYRALGEWMARGIEQARQEYKA